MAETQTTQSANSTPGYARPCIKCGCGERNYRGQCVACKRASDSAYQKANRKTINAKRKVWRKDNERDKAVSDAWVANNRESVRAASARWRERHAETAQARTAAWAAAHPEACRVHSANRRGRKRQSGKQLSSDLPQKLFTMQKGRCACCAAPLGDDFHLDHIVPLARGGEHEDDNIQLLTAACNLSKAAKDPIDFMQSRGFLL